MELKIFYKPNVFGVVLFIFAIPLMMISHDVLIKKIPDALYYPFVHSSGFLYLSVYFLPIVLLFWGACNGLNWFLKRLRLFLKNILQVFVFLVLLAVTFFSMIFGMIPGGARFDVGHPFCVHELLENVERCEGRNYGFMQARYHGAVMLGAPVSDLEQKILSLDKYSMQKTSCDGLAGGFGQECYSGHYFADTGDHYYMNVYINDEALLVVKTVNAALDGSSNEYETFFDLKRFK